MLFVRVYEASKIGWTNLHFCHKIWTVCLRFHQRGTLCMQWLAVDVFQNLLQHCFTQFDHLLLVFWTFLHCNMCRFIARVLNVSLRMKLLHLTSIRIALWKQNSPSMQYGKLLLDLSSRTVHRNAESEKKMCYTWNFWKRRSLLTSEILRNKKGMPTVTNQPAWIYFHHIWEYSTQRHSRLFRTQVAVIIEKKPPFPTCTVQFPGPYHFYLFRQQQWVPLERICLPLQSQLCLLSEKLLRFHFQYAKKLQTLSAHAVAGTRVGFLLKRAQWIHIFLPHFRISNQRTNRMSEDASLSCAGCRRWQGGVGGWRYRYQK